MSYLADKIRYLETVFFSPCTGQISLDVLYKHKHRIFKITSCRKCFFYIKTLRCHASFRDWINAKTNKANTTLITLHTPGTWPVYTRRWWKTWWRGRQRYVHCASSLKVHYLHLCLVQAPWTCLGIPSPFVRNGKYDSRITWPPTLRELQYYFFI